MIDQASRNRFRTKLERAAAIATEILTDPDFDEWEPDQHTADTEVAAFRLLSAVDVLINFPDGVSPTLVALVTTTAHLVEETTA